ncbi:MAG TPA: hypothetical protein VKV17_14615 [Bryobacteraceae bacterium]|nr:hypothetical protein [Bryobacteraceae bacterium]
MNQIVLFTFLGAAVLLGLWWAVLRLSRRPLKIQVVLKKQHYVQACAQLAVMVYWGAYWHQIHSYAYLIAAQLVFAYAFDLLLGWTRRGAYTLGFAPFPVIFSINLFLWFKPDWFYLQFVMVALGLAGKDLIRWNREGRQVHIFNPSSFPLAVFSLALLATGATDITFGQNIASTQFYPPQMYLALFLIGLPAQFLFGVASMTMSAAVSLFLFSRLYFAATGVYFFYDSYIPISVFLGMHLLFNDPSTSPRTELGRILYGMLYGLSTAVLYRTLGMAGMPTFYDKLIQVPLLNLSVKGIDRFSNWLGSSAAVATRRRNLAYMGAWSAAFIVLSVTGGLGDHHPGQWLPFWRKACQEGKPYACPYVADVTSAYCERGSGWACNEAGLLDIALSRSGEDPRRLDPGTAADPLRRGCELGFAAACGNLNALIHHTGRFAASPPTIDDFPIILRGSKGPVREHDPAALYALACREGWPNTCAPELARERGAQ